MLKFNTDKKTFEPLIQSELRTENLLERYDFQVAMIRSWETIKNEIGLPNSYLIGQEVNPHKSVGNAIDLLAFDADDNSLVVIELKRDRNKLQLLQALSYAAMVAKWGKEVIIEEIQRDINPNPAELIDLINDNELNEHIKIILISELYDPEVIITAEWLSSYYEVDITAFAVRLLKLENQTIVNFEQRLPLKELDDVYEVRSKHIRSNSKINTITWDDILPKLKYSFAKRALEFGRKTKEGYPSRRQIVGFRTNFDGFDAISINYRENYLNIYTRGKFESAEEFIKSKFKSPIEVNHWLQGNSFNISTEEQFNDLQTWLDREIKS